jgi:hypothetical protein
LASVVSKEPFAWELRYCPAPQRRLDAGTFACRNTTVAAAAPNKTRYLGQRGFVQGAQRPDVTWLPRPRVKRSQVTSAVRRRKS